MKKYEIYLSLEPRDENNVIVALFNAGYPVHRPPQNDKGITLVFKVGEEQIKEVL